MTGKVLHSGTQPQLMVGFQEIEVETSPLRSPLTLTLLPLKDTPGTSASDLHPAGWRWYEPLVEFAHSYIAVSSLSTR